MKSFLRRLKGAVGNALVWSAAWAGASFLFWGAWILFGGMAVPVSDPWALLAMVSRGAATSGLITGLVFSAYLGVAHREGGVLGISVGRSALMGGVVAAAVPVVTNLVWMAVTGSVVPAGVLAYIAVMPFFLGAATAGGTVFIARREALRLDHAAARGLAQEQREVHELLSG